MASVRRQHSTRMPAERHYSAQVALSQSSSASGLGSVGRFFSLRGWGTKTNKKSQSPPVQQAISAPLPHKAPIPELPAQQRAARAAAAALSNSTSGSTVSSSRSAGAADRFDWDSASYTSQSSIESPDRRLRAPVRPKLNIPDIVLSSAETDYALCHTAVGSPQFQGPLERGSPGGSPRETDDDGSTIGEDIWERDVRRNTITQAFYQTRLPSIRVESGLSMEEVFAQVEAKYSREDVEELRFKLESRRRNHVPRRSYSKRSSTNERESRTSLAYMQDSDSISHSRTPSDASLKRPAPIHVPGEGELIEDEYAIFSPRFAAMRGQRTSATTSGSPFSQAAALMGQLPEVVVQPATPVSQMHTFINADPPARSSSRDAILKHGSPSSSIDFDSADSVTPPLSPDSSEEDLDHMLDELQRPLTPVEKASAMIESDPQEGEIVAQTPDMDVDAADERFADAVSIYPSASPRDGLGFSNLGEEADLGIQALSSELPAGHARSMSDDSITDEIEGAVVVMCEKVQIGSQPSSLGTTRMGSAM